MTSLYVLQRQPIGSAKARDYHINPSRANLAPTKRIKQIGLTSHIIPNDKELKKIVIQTAINEGGCRPTTYYVRATGTGIYGSIGLMRLEVSTQDIQEFLDDLREEEGGGHYKPKNDIDLISRVY